MHACNNRIIILSVLNSTHKNIHRRYEDEIIEAMKMEAEEGERHTQREKERDLKMLPCCL